MTRAANIEAGYAVYSKKSLKVYDLVVHQISNRWLWRCPTEKLVDLHTNNVTDQHLDIGVATGIFLDRATWPNESPNITLMDLNEHCLDVAAKRLARFSPKVVQADVFDPLPSGPKYQSISLGYLLHCLPGPMESKAPHIFDNVANALAPDGVIFGSTLVQGDAPRNVLAQKLMNVYNKKGVFSNTDDTYDDLRTALDSTFKDVTLERHGCAVLFKAFKR